MRRGTLYPERTEIEGARVAVARAWLAVKSLSAF